MKYRTFGRLGWPVSDIGYGMWGMAGWTGSDDDESLQSLQKSIDLGCTFFDTAWAYGNGHSERLLGDTVRANRGKRLYTASKIPPKNGEWPSRRGATLEETFPPDHIEDYVHKSLGNLGLESLDLIQFHVWEDDWMDDRRWYERLCELKADGLIGGIGISINRWEPWNGVRAVREGLVDAVQVIYNIFDQNPEDELFPACRENGVAVIVRVPFDEGTLTGTLTKESSWPVGDWRNTYFVKENLVASVDRAEALRPHIPDGMTMAQLALGFILSNSDVSTVIPGMRKLNHVIDNVEQSERAGLGDDLLAVLKDHRWDR